jgi:carbohydrate-binding DOMON domain-containing protein
MSNIITRHYISKYDSRSTDDGRVRQSQCKVFSNLEKQITRMIQILYHSLLIISLALACNFGKESKNHKITEEEAESFMSSYISTLRSGDTEAIRKYWSKTSLNRKGFDVMHIWIGAAIHIKHWESFLHSTQYTYQFKELLEEDGYYVINGEWKKPNGDSGVPESHWVPFYLVWENKSWLLINPIDILTKNWSRYETSNMIFVYPKGINIDDQLQEIKLLDEEYQSMCKAMNFYFDDKIEYYKASSPEECGRLLTQPPFNGLAAVTYQDSIAWFQIAVSTTFYNPHEVMHIVSLSSGIPYGNLFFSEGLAVAYGGTTFQTAEYADIYSKNVLDDTNYIPIERLMTMSNREFVRLNYITYQEAGSFVRYLVEVYGIDKLKDFVSKFNVSGDLDAQSRSVFNSSLDALEMRWKEYLCDIDLPEVGFSISDKAQLVFSMSDPKNDDKGDGDYEYPSDERYVKGCFDLTKFEVFQEGTRVCFRVGLQKVIEPVSVEPGGTKSIPAIVIAINKGNKHERQLYKYTNEVELADGYDLKINVGFGINISNNMGKIFVSTNDFYNEIANRKSNNLTFSLPIEIIGEPEEGWTYFVGVGLTNEPAFNFSGLRPVRKSGPGFISGGNYDYSNPAFIDILLPENIDQSNVLSDYDSKTGRLATIEMVTKTSKGL